MACCGYPTKILPAVQISTFTVTFNALLNEGEGYLFPNQTDCSPAALSPVNYITSVQAVNIVPFATVRLISADSPPPHTVQISIQTNNGNTEIGSANFSGGFIPVTVPIIPDSPGSLNNIVGGFCGICQQSRWQHCLCIGPDFLYANRWRLWIKTLFYSS